MEMNDKIIATDVCNIEEFLNKYYRRDRYTGRGLDYASAVLQSHQESLNHFGHTLISRHDSVLGQAVWFYKEAA